MKEDRPWGSFEILSDMSDHKVKRITVNPGHKLSLQKHEMRNEHWVFLQGQGVMTLNHSKFPVNTERYVHVPVGSLHRIENTGKELLILIEIQTGTYFGEDDIERFSDDYGRA